jgi:hypothetical protein
MILFNLIGYFLLKLINCRGCVIQNYFFSTMITMILINNKENEVIDFVGIL